MAVISPPGSIESTRGSMITFVIPAYNEERYIAATLASIAARCEHAHEIIVVDNGSTDATTSLARDAGARVLVRGGGTIGGLRNVGAAQACGDMLVFLDADVTLTSSWSSAFEAACSRLAGERLVLAGSTCSIPAQASWIERVWFGPRSEASLSHLGSAHLIIRTDVFRSLGGFDQSLETGEDYDLSMRVIAAGGELHRMPKSTVEHHGFPATIGSFMRREVWHGTSDCVSLAAVVRSRVATAALAFFALHLTAAAALAAGWPLGAAAALTLVVAMCAASSLRTFRGNRTSILLANCVLYYLYYWARVFSFLRAARRRPRQLTPVPQQDHA